MNKSQQDKLEAILDATLLDGKLSRDEEKVMRSVVEAIDDDRQALAFLRNLAFRKAMGLIEEAPAKTINWLQRVDKIIDNATRNQAPATTAGPIRCAFSPGEDGRGLIQQEIRDAKSSLDICVFTITDDRITDRVIDAHRQGITVRIITDNDKQHDTGSDIARLRGAGIEVRQDPDDDHMHHKFAVIDRKRLITGSYNWTRGATYNHENVLVLSDKDTLARFGKEFDRLWDSFG